MSRKWRCIAAPRLAADDEAAPNSSVVASRMAIDATTELFGAASSSAAKRGTAMQRHFRDSAIYLGHIPARHDVVAADVARLHFGLPDHLF